VLAKFLYNNLVYNNTRKTPFYLLYSYKLKIDIKDTILVEGDIRAQERVEKLQAKRKELTNTLQKAIKLYKKHYD
jgi:hypothetical protein